MKTPFAGMPMPSNIAAARQNDFITVDPLVEVTGEEANIGQAVTGPNGRFAEGSVAEPVSKRVAPSRGFSPGVSD